MYPANKKITKATLKSFINKNKKELFIEVNSNFSASSDMVEYDKDASFHKIEETNDNGHNFGIAGIWLVGSSRDYFSNFNNGTYKGIHVYNCCGSFTIAVKI